MKNKFNLFDKAIKLIFCLSIITIAFYGCRDAFDYDLPDSNSKVDTILPNANFSYASTLEDFKTVKFTNLSIESITFSWDFGGGNTSGEEDPTFTFAGEGTFPVSLTASDGRGESSTITIDVEVVEGPFQPIILEAGFEDNTLPDGSGNGVGSWEAGFGPGFDGIQITGSPVTFGLQGAKLPSDQTRIGYQEIAVEANTNYDLRFWYTMLANSNDPFLTVSIVGVTQFGPITSRQEAVDGTIASVTVNDTSDPSEYLEQKLSFSSGDNEVVAIYFFNGPVECRLDNFSIEVGAAGAVPPSAGFDVVQSEVDYLEYSFQNTSTDGDTYMWDFGDGNTSTEESPTHVYAEPDQYTVTLEVTSATGLSASLEKTFQILAPVTADFTSEVDADDYSTYHFMDASEGAAMLLWEFGDGFQFTGMNPSHTYSEDGIYTVTLTAYSITNNTSTATAQLVVAQGFVVQVLNGTFDEYTENTGDNADAWDMTPNSTVVDNNGNTIPSPYDPLWDNGALDTWLDGFFGDNSEQPASTGDGTGDTRGAKLNEPSRRLYQVVLVEVGATYTFSIDTRSEAEGVNTEVYILNTQIADEEGINASNSDPAIDAYFEINNDFNTDKEIFVTSTFTFTPTTSEVVIYVRSTDAIDSSHEVFIDNITIQ